MAIGQREAALQDLHDRHAPELWRFAMRLTHDRQLSEDVVQEVLLKAWKDPGLVDRHPGAARAWLFTACRNLIIDRWRSASSRHELQTDEPPEGLLGDIVLCPAVTSRQAAEHGRSANAEAEYLLVHGLLHLLGYDHADPDEKAEMFGLKDKIIEAWALQRPDRTS